MTKSQEKLAQITHSKLKEELQRDFENDIENQVEKNARRGSYREGASNTRPTGTSRCFIKHKVNE